MRADSSIRKIATQKNDSKILALVSRELVAAEAWYHRTCYRSYTRPEASSSLNPDMSRESPDDEYARIEEIHPLKKAEMFDTLACPKDVIRNTTYR